MLFFFMLYMLYVAVYAAFLYVVDTPGPESHANFGKNEFYRI